MLQRVFLTLIDASDVSTTPSAASLLPKSVHVQISLSPATWPSECPQRSQALHLCDGFKKIKYGSGNSPNDSASFCSQTHARILSMVELQDPPSSQGSDVSLSALMDLSQGFMGHCQDFPPRIDLEYAKGSRGLHFHGQRFVEA